VTWLAPQAPKCHDSAMIADLLLRDPGYSLKLLKALLRGGKILSCSFRLVCPLPPALHSLARPYLTHSLPTPLTTPFIISIVPRNYPQLNEGVFFCSHPSLELQYLSIPTSLVRLCMGTCHNPRWLGRAGFRSHSSDSICEESLAPRSARSVGISHYWKCCQMTRQDMVV
jgi:hypothetical protein